MEAGSFTEPGVLAVIVALVAILLTTAYLIYRILSKKASDTVLIVGLSYSGKTQVFSKIANKNAEPITYTSLEENYVELDIKGRPLKIVDFPGAERLRKQLVEKWLKKERHSLKKIVFVVDSATFSKRARDVAEFLYDVALESAKKIPIVVACNKQDLGLAKTQQVISITLEKEIGLINRSRAAALTTTDGSSNNNTLTSTADEFQWADLPKSVDFVVCSAVGSPGLDDLRSIVKA